jgi:hypothetical protein
MRIGVHQKPSYVQMHAQNLVINFIEAICGGSPAVPRQTRERKRETAAAT